MMPQQDSFAGAHFHTPPLPILIGFIEHHSYDVAF